MGLEETFEQVAPSIVALGSRISLLEPKAPIFPTIVGTGFVVDARGIVVTNRHVADLHTLQAHPVTQQDSAFAMFVGPLIQLKGQWLRAVFFTNIKHYAVLDHFDSDRTFYGRI